MDHWVVSSFWLTYKDSMDICVQVFIWTHVLISIGWLPRNEVTRSYNRCVFHWKMVSQSGWKILGFHKQQFSVRQICNQGGIPVKINNLIKGKNKIVIKEYCKGLQKRTTSDSWFFKIYILQKVKQEKNWISFLKFVFQNIRE